MKKIFFAILISLITATSAIAQGIIRGKISDKSGETLIGVTVILKSNPGIGVATDLDGNYSIKIKDSTAQTLLISYISYKTIEAIVHPKNGEVIVKDFVLESASNELGTVEVVAKVSKWKEYYMENIKINEAKTIEYVSGDAMKNRGDANVTTAVARVSGVSTNGGFITVRGIGDRYVKTTINGSRIPTLDPFTNNIKLDLFPASLVDNVIITKTASPDLPGDWAGAYISVETKDYPDQLTVNVESQVGYNNQTTFKDVVSSQRSTTDWLGYDNNFRDRNHNDFVNFNTNPSQYAQLSALGLGDYYKSIGVTGWIDDGSQLANTYYKLGLVQLGLLPKAQMDDAVAFKNAQDLYNNGSYKQQAFNTINAGVPATGKSFANNWNTTTRKAPLNFTQSFNIGNQMLLFGKPLGFIAGFRYSSAIQYDPKSTVNRIDDKGTTTSSLNQQISRENNGWSALVNVAYKLTPNNTVSLLFMPNLTGVNTVRNSLDTLDASENKIGKSQLYEQRKQLVYQYKSEHYISGPKIKIEANASYTNGKSSVPDFRNLIYVHDPKSNTYQLDRTIGEGINRNYRYLTDNLFDSRLSAELPIQSNTDNPDLIRKLKFGGAYQLNNKKSDQYQYLVNPGLYANNTLVNNNLDQYFDQSNFNIQNGVDKDGKPINSVNLYYSNNSTVADHTFGYSKIAAAYAMLDYSIIPALRFSGGLRVENGNIFTDVYSFNALGYEANDKRRFVRDGSPLINPGKLNEINYLPSANAIYKLKSDTIATINVRLNFSQTIARPSIRELSDLQSFDNELRAPVFGNSNLKTVHIKNYDFRFESYFNSGDNVSVSLFYKDFKNHIELVNSNGYTWQNVDKSYVTGLELEGKKTISKHFDVRANVTFVKSQSKFVRSTIDIGSDGMKKFTPVDTISRAMFGQAPYILNGILTYSSDKTGLTIALSYNVQGPRLVISSNNKAIPDVYELSRHLIDFKTSKTLGKHFSVNLTVRDILNATIKREYKGSGVLYDTYRYGTNFVLGIAYKL